MVWQYIPYSSDEFKLEKSIMQKNQIKISARFSQFSISSLREKGHEPSRAELKILQLELWLEPAQLGLITSK